MAITTPTAMLFDLDGLLIDSEPIWVRAEQKLTIEWGGTWSEEDAIQSRGTGIPRTAERMAERAGRPFDATRDPELLVDAFLGLAASVQEKRGARSLIDRARASRVRCAVASSSPRRVVTLVLESLGLAPLFECVVTGDDVVRKKPDPAIFLLAAERLGEPRPHMCLVLEDSMPGVLAGKNARMQVVAVPEIHRESFVGVADAVFDDLVQVESAIFGSR